jgi:hypothetical protein
MAWITRLIVASWLDRVEKDLGLGPNEKLVFDTRPVRLYPFDPRGSRLEVCDICRRQWPADDMISLTAPWGRILLACSVCQSRAEETAYDEPEE